MAKSFELNFSIICSMSLLSFEVINQFLGPFQRILVFSFETTESGFSTNLSSSTLSSFNDILEFFYWAI